jgi:hypothetical protein
MTPAVGTCGALNDGRTVRVLSSTFYNEMASEPTTVVAPVLTREPAAGFGVPIGDDNWAAPGFISSLRKSRLIRFRDRVGIQALTT